MINEKAFIINAIFDYFHISESTLQVVAVLPLLLPGVL